MYWRIGSAIRKNPGGKAYVSSYFGPAPGDHSAGVCPGLNDAAAPWVRC
jgi:hypothetical protein